MVPEGDPCRRVGGQTTWAVTRRWDRSAGEQN